MQTKFESKSLATAQDKAAEAPPPQEDAESKIERVRSIWEALSEHEQASLLNVPIQDLIDQATCNGVAGVFLGSHLYAFHTVSYAKIPFDVHHPFRAVDFCCHVQMKMVRLASHLWRSFSLLLWTGSRKRLLGVSGFGHKVMKSSNAPRDCATSCMTVFYRLHSSSCYLRSALVMWSPKSRRPSAFV